MATLIIRTWKAELFRADGEFVDETEIDENDEDLAKSLLCKEFENEELPGDEIIITPSTERISEEEYEKAGMSNEILNKED